MSLSLLLVPSTASAPPTAPQAATKPPGCTKTYNRRMFHRAAKAAVHNRITNSERRVVRRVVRCQRSDRSRANVRFHWFRYRHAYRMRMVQVRARAAASRYTPFNCGSRGNWAIPCAIIACESGFSWSAYNPSGALGPYQLLGKGAPWPADTPAKRLAHHRIAYNLYAGGAGRSHWVC